MKMPDKFEEKLDTNIIIPITPNTVGISNHEGYGNSYYYKIGTRVHVHLGLKVEPKNLVDIIILPERI
jgi:hypothetical protein